MIFKPSDGPLTPRRYIRDLAWFALLSACCLSLLMSMAFVIGWLFEHVVAPWMEPTW